MEAILARAKTALSEEEYTKLHAAIETLVFLTAELKKKRVSVQRLRPLLFGATTETTRKVMEKILDEAGKEGKSGDDAAEGKEAESRQKAKGHGRNGAAAYVGAEKIPVPYASLKPGDSCPNCQKGKGKKRSYAYYRCIGSDAYRFGGQRLCYNKQVRTDLLEEAVWQDICSLLKEPQRISKEYERRLAKPTQDGSLNQLKALAQKVKRGIGRLIDAY